MKAAIETAHIAETMEALGMLYVAYALTIDVIAMAATSLLVVELMPLGDILAGHAKRSSWKAHALLQNLALWNCAATRCMDSLLVSTTQFWERG